MNAPAWIKPSRAVLALAGLGFALGTWLAPASAAPSQRVATPPKVTVTGNVTTRKPVNTRQAYGGSTCEWDGTNGNWSNGTKWSCGHVPNSSDEAVIGAGTVTLDSGMFVSRFTLEGGTMEIPSLATVENEFRQAGGRLNLRQDGTIAFPHGHRFLQDGGTLAVEIGGRSRFGRMDFDNHIGGLGLFGLGGNLEIVGMNGFVPGDDDEFLFMNGSSMSATGSGYTPQVSHTDFPVDFQPVLGLFSGKIRNLFPGACRWIGGYSVFSNPSNWSCGRVPTASDTAILDAAQIEMNGSFTVGRLIARNYPRLFGFGNTLTALGQPQRNELTGSMDLSQDIVLALGDSFAVNAHFSLYGQSVILNQGHFSATAGSLLFDSGSGGVVHNAPGATIDLKLSSLSFYGGDIELLNEGEIVLNTPQQGSILTLEVQDGARIRQTQGRFVLNDVVGNYFEPPPTFQLEGGEFVGNGRFDFPMNNVGGLVRPGMPTSCGGGGEADAPARASVAAFTAPTECSRPGYLEFLGYTQGPDGTLELQLGSGGDDDFSITGPANLAGKLSLRDLNGLRPVFDLNLFFGFPMHGAFATFDSDFGPDYTLEYRSNTVILKYSPSVPNQPPAFVNAPPFTGSRVAEPFTFTFSATGSPAPSFSVASGAMPPGLTLAPNGVLSGTPMGNVGTYEFTVQASNGVPPAATQPVNFELTTGWPASLEIEGGGVQSATLNHSFGEPLRVIMRDAASNPVALTGVDWIVPLSGASATLSSYSEATGVDGRLAITATANGVPGAYEVRARTSGLEQEAVFNLTNQPAASAALLTLSGFTAHGYGEAVTFLFSARDAATGEPLQSGTARVTVNDVQVCSVTLPLTQCRPTAPIDVGVFVVRAFLDSPTHAAAPFESSIFIGKHPGAMGLTVPATATQGTPLQVRAALRYQGDISSFFPGTLPPAGALVVRKGATVVCSTPVTAIDMALDCSVPVTDASPFTITGEFSGDSRWAALSASQPVTVTGTPPVKPTFTSGVPANGRVAIAYTHTFTASGTSPITFSLGSGTLPAGLTLTNDGILSGTPTTPGTFNTSISASNVAGSAAQSVTITIAPTARTRLEIAGGNHQSAFYDRARLTGDAFPAPLKLRVIDADGAPVTGQRVEFVSLSLNASAVPRADLSAQSVVTSEKGEASVIATAANGLGPHQVRAGVTGLDPVVFDLTNLARRVGTVELAEVRISSANHKTPLLAPFFSDIEAALISKLDPRAPVPGREVRFYVPFDPNGSKASAVLEGATSGRLTAAESTRPDDGFYRFYATAISGNDSIARVKGFANNVAGAYDVIAVLVNEGDPLDPTLAIAGQRLAIPVENLATNLTVRLSPGTLQQARALEAYPQEIVASVFNTATGPTGGIPGAEVWIFAGDDARGEAGATIVAPDGIEGRLAGGERYTALTVDIRGGARFTAVANRYKGAHKITIAYPGSYATLQEAKIQASNPFLNTTGATPDGGTGEGPRVASLEIVSGDFQRAVSGSRDPFAFPLVARARDASGKPLANALVRFVPIAAFDGTRVVRRSSAILTDSSMLTDAEGLAHVGARPDGDGQGEFQVRAFAEGAEPVHFTLRLTANTPAPDTVLAGVQRSTGRTPTGFIGQDQSQVTLARFDEPLSVVAGSIAGRTPVGGQPVRFHYPDGAFDPEGGTPGVFTDSAGKQHPFVTVVADVNGRASLRGIAGPNAGAFEVIALLPDPSPANDNDPTVVDLRKDGRTFVFKLRNASPGVTLTLEQGSFQGVETGQPFLRTLRVRALPANPDAFVSHPAPGLDGADLWFMSPLVTDDKTPSAALVGGDVHTLVDSSGKAWRVVAIPIADDGIAEATAIANDVRGTHRIIAAYPGNFADPASAPFKVEFFLCNGQARTAPCQDPGVTPGSIELVDAGALFTFNSAPPPLRVRVKSQLGQVMAGTSVGFFASGVGVTGTSPYVLSGSQFSAGFTTDANGIANGAPGLSVANANQEYTVTARAGTLQVPLRFTRYAAPSTITPVGPIVSAALINTLHRALQVTTPNPAPIEWTVLPGPSGASATFAGGALVARDIQPATRPGAVTFTLPALTANGIAGTFTLKATIVGTSITATFAMVNQASAPGSVTPADPAPHYAYGGASPPIRALVRDTNGQPLAGVPVTFTAQGAFTYSTPSPWIRTGSGSATTRVVTTNADGIADATGGISLLNSYSPETIVAAVQGVAQPARIEVVRYNPPSVIRAVGTTSSATLIGTQHAQMVVELAPAIPVRWTIVAAANGAGGTFADGATTAIRHPSPTGPGTQQMSAVVRANAIAGTFTLRAQQLDGTGIPPVDFTLVNLATAPGTIAPADPAPRYTYAGASPPIRAVVRDAAGQPLAGVPVTFTAQGAFTYSSSSPWIRTGSGSATTRLVTTGADGIADATGGISLLNSYAPETIIAAVQGVTQTARIEVVRYNPPGAIRPVGATSSAVVIGSQHAPMVVELVPAIPVRWTIVAAPNGAGGTFSDGTTTAIRHPSPTGPGAQQMSAVVTANAIAGTFTLRVQQLDGTGIAPVDFTLANLATAPASVAPADPAPRYTYGGASPPIRAMVRDAAGQPLAGVPVTFTAQGAFTYSTPSPWSRVGSSLASARVVVTGADGIADATGGISLLNSYSPETIVAAVQGVTQAARIEVVRYNLPSRVTAFGATTSIAAIDTLHAEMRVEMVPQVPIRWTILAGPNGAGGRFADGTDKTVTFPGGLAGGLGVGYSSAAVKANGIVGTFTLRAQPADFPGFAPVDFTLTNLSALPASIERVDPGLLFSYSASAPALRVIVRDANGAPIAGVPVKFEAEGDISRIWERIGGLNVRTFTTNADGIADGSQFLRSTPTYVPNQVTATVPGVSRAATMAWFHYLPVDQIDPVDGLIYTGAPGAQHLVRVRMDPPVPLRWTIIGSPGGAGGAFLNGATVMESVPVGSSSAAQTMQFAVRSNSIRGVYTVKIEAIGIEGPAVVIAVVSE